MQVICIKIARTVFRGRMGEIKTNDFFVARLCFARDLGELFQRDMEFLCQVQMRIRTRDDRSNPATLSFVLKLPEQDAHSSNSKSPCLLAQRV